MLEVKNVRKTYHTKDKESFELKSINLSIGKGELVSLIGGSGAGKSTLLKLIYGVIDADEGEVWFNGKRIWGPAEQLLPGCKGLQYVPQDYSLNIYADVYENIAPVLPNTDLEYKKQRIEEVLNLLNIADLKHQQVIRLSGGQQQRVALARAIANKPDMLLLDEPFSNLDTVLKRHLKRDLEQLVEQTDISILMVTHDSFDALSLSTKIIVLKNGEIVQEGTPHNIYTRPNSSYVAKLFGEINVLDVRSFSAVFSLKTHLNAKVLVHFHQFYVSKKQEQGAVQGLISAIDYNGSYELLIIEVPQLGRKIQVSNFQMNAFKQGDTVFVSCGDYIEVKE